LGEAGGEKGEGQGTVATEEIEEAHQCSNGGGSCAALATRTGVGIEVETDGGATPNMRDPSWRCRNWRELGLAVTHQSEEVTEVV
jgi:hypothetical protein